MTGTDIIGAVIFAWGALVLAWMLFLGIREHRERARWDAETAEALDIANGNANHRIIGPDDDPDFMARL